MIYVVIWQKKTRISMRVISNAKTGSTLEMHKVNEILYENMTDL